MQPGKGVPEQHVAAAPSRVQLPAWRLVVAKVGEPPGLRIERVRPIWVGSARVQGDKLASRPRAARVSESTLVADWKQPSQGIVSRVAGTPPRYVASTNRSVSWMSSKAIWRGGEFLLTGAIASG